MAFKSSLLAVTFSAVLFGQNMPAPPAPGDQPDPEDRNHGVARISLLNGDVSVRRGDSGDILAANVNAPMLSGDGIQTGPASRAEIEFDVVNRLRLNALTEVQMGDLRAGTIQAQVVHGTVMFTVIGDQQANVEISTPIASLKPAGRGAFRILVGDDGSVEFTVRAGDADIYTQHGSQRVSAGQTMMLRGNVADPEFQIVSANPPDEWDQFNETRDRELSRSTAYQHVSRDVPGAADLDQSGRWNNDPTYGDVWVPNVSADWAPYQSGRWVWEDYYGWTWVSYDPWGWAPYHYGRWFRASYGWAWVPGPIYGRHSYRPALVAFFGYGPGPGFGFGFGFGNLGWVALAPFEAFHPWWGRGFAGRGIGGGIVNVNIYNTYRNARVTNGVMGVSAQGFQNGIAGRYTHPGIVQMQSAGAVHGQLPVTPGNSNLRFNDRATSVSARTVSSQQRFVTRGGFAPVQRQSFAQQRQTLEHGSPAGAQSAPAGRGTMSSPSSGSSNWQRFGSPSNSSAPRPAAAASQQPSSGWGRFGSPSSNTGSAYGRPNTQSQPAYQGQSAPRQSAAPSRPSGSYSAPRQSSPPPSSSSHPSGSSSAKSTHSSGSSSHR